MSAQISDEVFRVLGVLPDGPLRGPWMSFEDIREQTGLTRAEVDSALCRCMYLIPPLAQRSGEPNGEGGFDHSWRRWPAGAEALAIERDRRVAEAKQASQVLEQFEEARISNQKTRRIAIGALIGSILCTAATVAMAIAAWATYLRMRN